jgi:hypothetical protein
MNNEADRLRALALSLNPIDMNDFPDDGVAIEMGGYERTVGVLRQGDKVLAVHEIDGLVSYEEISKKMTDIFNIQKAADKRKIRKAFKKRMGFKR